jgi:hypothetical protein
MDQRFQQTRRGLHALAEQVLAPARYREEHRIGLVAAPGGIATPPFGPKQKIVGIRGAEIYVTEDGRERHAEATTLGAAARFVGIDAGVPEALWTPVTERSLNAPLKLQADVVEALSDWYELVGAAITELSESIGDEVAPPQLWPEHFDLATSANEVNLGGSAGDTFCEMPYLYVGPWRHPLNNDAFWNAPFGAAMPISEVTSVDTAVAFFRAGYDLAVTASGTNPPK